MELILKTDSAAKAAEVIALAKKLDISFEMIEIPLINLTKREELKNRILSFKAKKTTEQGLSSLISGSFDKEKVAKMNQELENMRNEWERDIF